MTDSVDVWRVFSPMEKAHPIWKCGQLEPNKGTRATKTTVAQIPLHLFHANARSLA
jgi:hypothetical protein